MRDLVADPLPEAIFHHLEVRRLAHNGGPVKMDERGEEVWIVPSEVGKDGGILLEPEILAHHLHRQRHDRLRGITKAHTSLDTYDDAASSHD